MTESNDPDNFLTDLVALADGELDAERARAVLSALAERPAALTWLQDQQRLTIETRKIASIEPPTDLRTRIDAMLADVNLPTGPTSIAATTFSPATAQVHDLRPSKRAQWRSLGSIAAVAASLLIGVVGSTLYWQTRGAGQKTSTNPPIVQTTDTPIAGKLVVRAERIHSDCSRLAAGLHDATFEKVNADLAERVRADLHGPVPYPDLSSIDFAYVGAGPCPALMPDTVHLLYRSTRPNSVASVSLFVQKNSGQFPMTAQNLYAVSSALSPYPMIAWQTDQIVYFLVTDNDAIQASVLRAMRLNATPIQSRNSADELPTSKK